MSTIPELIKLLAHWFRENKFDEVQNILVERERNMNMQLGNLMRECESLRKQVDFLERTQGYSDLEKCSLEEKLGRSGRRCEELEKRAIQMGELIEKLSHQKWDVEVNLERTRRKCEELKRKEIDADRLVKELQRKNDELRVKRMEPYRAAEVYKSRLGDLESMILKVEENPANVVGAMDKSATAAAKEDFPDFVENRKVNVAARYGDASSREVRATFGHHGSSGGMGLSMKVNGAMDKSAAAAERDFPGFVENRKVNVAARCGDASSLEVRATSSHPGGSGGIGLSMKVKGVSYPTLYSRCDLKIINVIKKNLRKENLERFEQSCFGHLLKINELRSQGHLMGHLLKCMDKDASNKERLVFNINNSNMEFGPSDFFLITELHFGTLEATKTSSSIHEDVFQGKPNIMLKDVEEAFLTASHDHKGRGELVLKLALLYFLHGILLVRNRCKSKIDLQYLHLVEDLQKFNAFPWGRVAYQFLVSSIISVRVRMYDSKVIHKFDLHGFSYALQAWAYEVMPSVATICASRANNFENLTPHILRWSAKKCFSFNEIKKIFTPGDTTNLKNTTVRSEELSAYTIPQAETPLSSSQRKKRKLHCDKDQMSHAGPTSEPSFAATPNTPHHLAGRLSRVEDMLESILRKIDEPVPDISCDDLLRNEHAQVEDEEAMKKAEQPASITTLIRHSVSGHNLISTNDATYKLDKSLTETEQVRDVFEHAIDDSSIDMPQLWKENCDGVGIIKRSIPQVEDRLESLQREFDQPILDISSDSEEAVRNAEQLASASTALRHPTFGPTLELAINNPSLDKPWKECNVIEISKSEYEYEKSKEAYERLLNQTKRLKLWVNYAKFEAFQKSDYMTDKIICLNRARVVFERALSYFRNSVPDLKEERGMLLEEWFNMEIRFGELGDVDLVRAKLLQDRRKRRIIETDDGPARYEEGIEYHFPDETRAKDVQILEAAYKWKNDTNKELNVYDQRARSQQHGTWPGISFRG